MLVYISSLNETVRSGDSAKLNEQFSRISKHITRSQNLGRYHVDILWKIFSSITASISIPLPLLYPPHCAAGFDELTDLELSEQFSRAITPPSGVPKRKLVFPQPAGGDSREIGRGSV